MPSFTPFPHYRVSEGIDRRLAPTDPSYPEGALWDALNMVYQHDAEKPEKMAGVTRLGTTDMDGTVIGLFDYAEGTRLIAACADGKIYEYAGTDWAQATGGTGFSTTVGVRWNGNMFYGATTAANLLILCNGVDAPQRYDSTNGVATLGGSPPATGQYPTQFGGRLWMVSGDTLFYSKTNDCETYTAPGGGSLLVDRGSGSITGLYAFGGDLLIFKRRATFRIPLGRIEEASVIPVSRAIGCSSYASLQEVATIDRNGLMLMSDAGSQMLIGTPSYEGYIYRDVGTPVQSLLSRRNTGSQTIAWATYNPNRFEYWLQYPAGTTTTPSEGLILNLARKHSKPRWTRHNRAGMTAGCLFRSSGKEIQVMGDTNGRVYQMHYGGAWAGDTDYAGRIVTAWYPQKRPDIMKVYNRVFVDAEAQGTTYPVYVRFALGRIGLPQPAGSAEGSTNFGVVDGWGEGTWGVAQWGGSGLVGDHIRPASVRRGNYIRITVETHSKDQWFRLNGSIVEAFLGSRQIVA